MRLRFENFGQKIVEPLMPGGAETAVPLVLIRRCACRHTRPHRGACHVCALRQLRAVGVQLTMENRGEYAALLLRDAGCCFGG